MNFFIDNIKLLNNLSRTNDTSPKFESKYLNMFQRVDYTTNGIWVSVVLKFLSKQIKWIFMVVLQAMLVSSFSKDV